MRQVAPVPMPPSKDMQSDKVLATRDVGQGHECLNWVVAADPVDSCVSFYTFYISSEMCRYFAPNSLATFRLRPNLKLPNSMSTTVVRARSRFAVR